MSWPNNDLLCRALTELLKLVDCASLWDGHGPTREAVQRLKEGPLTGGQRVMLASAFALYNDSANPAKPEATIGRIAAALDQKNLHALLTLTMACRIGPPAVEAWLADHACRHFRMPGQHCASAACNGAEGWPEGETRTPRESEWPFCNCPCTDCVQARSTEPLGEGTWGSRAGASRPRPAAGGFPMTPPAGRYRGGCGPTLTDGELTLTLTAAISASGRASGIMRGMTNHKIKPVAFLLSSLLVSVSVASCRHHVDPKTAVWGPQTCEVTAKNTSCGACLRTQCCAEFQACALEAPCPCWFQGRMGLLPEQSLVARCGPQNASYKAYATCIDTHCPSECPADAAHHALLGKPAPEIVVAPVLAPELPSEGPKSLAEARGRVVIVEFWATFCGPCKWSFPRYQEIVDRYHGDVAMLAVSGDDPDIVEIGKLVDFARDTRVHFPIFWDRTGETQRVYGQRGAFPKSFVIDRAGIVRFVHAGYGPADVAQFLAEIEALVAEPAPKTPSGDAAPSGRSTP